MCAPHQQGASFIVQYDAACRSGRVQIELKIARRAVKKAQ
jgi:hypothetical protein